MNKIISFSIWGKDPKYCVGAIINAQLAKKYFPGWTCYFYYNNTVPKIYIDALNGFDNVKTIEITDNSYGAFWRLYPMQKNTIVLSRDTDSRLSEREKTIIDDWLLTNKNVCIMRDHIRHYDFFILTGMLSVKDGLPENIFSEMKTKLHETWYAAEQVFIGDSIKKYMFNECEIYGFKEKAWLRDTYSSLGKDFIGQSYDENNVPVYDAQIKD